MITRIVRMTFHEKYVSDFQEMFNNRKQQIRSRNGCEFLALYREQRFPNVFFTISYWKDEEALESYRNSDLFMTTWKQTKSWFAARPQAWSLEEIVTLD